MKRAIFTSLPFLLIATLIPAYAAVHAKVEGWKFHNITPGSAASAFTGGAIASFTKDVPNPEKGTATVDIYALDSADIAKLNERKETWRAALLTRLKSQPAILNESVITVGGKKRYMIEYQTDTGGPGMLQSAVMGVVIDGKLYKFVYEQNQIIYRNEISDVRRLYESVNLINK